MNIVEKHRDLVTELDKRQHEKMSDAIRRFHHGKNAHDVAELHVMLHQVGYYPAGVDRTIKDAWAAFRFNKSDRPLHQVGVHRKTDPRDPEMHFTDIILY